jgi:hypothetical protein
MNVMKKENKKNLIIMFCSFRPKQYSKETCEAREKEYVTCISHNLKIIPSEDFDVIITDNTISSLEELTNFNLISLLQEEQSVKDVLFFEKNLGEKNKGVGELQMLKGVMDSINPEDYETICYCTARKIFTNPYCFERAENLKKQALISNPDFFYFFEKKYELTEKNGLYNDMFFAMKSKTMSEYAEYSFQNLDKMISYNIGSEQNLYQFIHSKNIEFEFIKWLGIIRNDWYNSKDYNDLKNFHIC